MGASSCEAASPANVARLENQQKLPAPQASRIHPSGLVTATDCDLTDVLLCVRSARKNEIWQQRSRVQTEGGQLLLLLMMDSHRRNHLHYHRQDRFCIVSDSI